MSYTRKTRTLFAVEGFYGAKWEIVTYDETKRNAVQSILDYRRNVPNVAFRIRAVREAIA